VTAAQYQEGGRAIVAALDALAAGRRTATARLTGAGVGAVGALYFRNGRAVGAELGGSPPCAARLIAAGRLTPGEWDEFAEACAVTGPQPAPVVPPAAGLGPAEWAAICVDALLDAAAELLPAASGRDSPNTGGDLVLQPGDVPGWTVSGRPVVFRELRDELRRRQSVLDRLRPIVTPDSVLRRIAADWVDPVQISARQWRVLRTVGTGASPREVAERSGSGVFATTVLVCDLIRLGMLATDAGPADPGAVPRVLLSADLDGRGW
jgi:hypothetical protein